MLNQPRFIGTEKSNPMKRGAIEYAEKMRKKGKFAGVVSEIDKSTGKTVWSVYTRDKG